MVTTKDTKGKEVDTGKEKEVEVKGMTTKLQPEKPKDGKASRYFGTASGQGVKAEHTGSISGKIAGKPASGKFVEK